MTLADVAFDTALPAGLVGAYWWRLRTVRRRRAAVHADDVLAAADLADGGQPYWHAALARVPAGVREEFLPETERTGPTGPTVTRSALTAAQAAGKFTEPVGGILVIPDGIPLAAPITEWAPGGVVKPVTVLQVERRAVDQARAYEAAGCQCPGCGTIPHGTGDAGLTWRPGPSLRSDGLTPGECY